MTKRQKERVEALLGKRLKMYSHLIPEIAKILEEGLTPDPSEMKFCCHEPAQELNVKESDKRKCDNLINHYTQEIMENIRHGYPTIHVLLEGFCADVLKLSIAEGEKKAG